MAIAAANADATALQSGAQRSAAELQSGREALVDALSASIVDIMGPAPSQACIENAIPWFEDTLPCIKNAIPCYEDTVPCIENALPCIENAFLCIENTIPNSSARRLKRRHAQIADNSLRSEEESRHKRRRQRKADR